MHTPQSANTNESSRRGLATLLLAASALTLAACGGGGGGSSNPAPTPPAANQPPSLSDAELSVAAGATASLRLQASDPDGSVSSCTVVDAPASGEASVAGQDLTFRAGATAGDTSFTVRCTDNDGANSRTATVSVTIGPAPQGRFLDTAVEGLAYSSGNLSGLTDGEGAFSYVEGEDLTFSLGGITLGSATAAPVVVPGDLQSEADAAGNIAQFLQTLDGDRIASNGITVPEATRDALADADIDFTVSAVGFQTAPDVQSALNALPSRPELLPREKTDAHLAGTLELLPEDGSNPALLASTFFGSTGDDSLVAAEPASAETGPLTWLLIRGSGFGDDTFTLPVPGGEAFGPDDYALVALDAGLQTVVRSRVFDNAPPPEPELDAPEPTEPPELRINGLDPLVVGGGRVGIVEDISTSEEGRREAVTFYSEDLLSVDAQVLDPCAGFRTQATPAEIVDVSIDATAGGTDLLRVLCRVDREFADPESVDNGLYLEIAEYDADLRPTQSYPVPRRTFGDDRIAVALVDAVYTPAGDAIFLLRLNEASTEGTPVPTTPETIGVLRVDRFGSFQASAVLNSPSEGVQVEAAAIALGPDGRVAVAGTVSADDATADILSSLPTPTEGAVRTVPDRRDGFVAVYNTDDLSLRSFSFVGADEEFEGIDDIAFDTGGNVHIVGQTIFGGLPVTANAVQSTLRGTTTYYAKLSSALDAVTYLTYFGEFQALPNRVSVLADGSAMLVGTTNDAGLPLTGDPTFASTPGGEASGSRNLYPFDVYVGRINPFGDAPASGD